MGGRPGGGGAPPGKPGCDGSPDGALPFPGIGGSARTGAGPITGGARLGGGGGPLLTGGGGGRTLSFLSGGLGGSVGVGGSARFELCPCPDVGPFSRGGPPFGTGGPLEGGGGGWPGRDGRPNAGGGTLGKGRESWDGDGGGPLIREPIALPTVALPLLPKADGGGGGGKESIEPLLTLSDSRVAERPTVLLPVPVMAL